MDWLLSCMYMSNRCQHYFAGQRTPPAEAGKRRRRNMSAVVSLHAVVAINFIAACCGSDKISKCPNDRRSFGFRLQRPTLHADHYLHAYSRVCFELGCRRSSVPPLCAYRLRIGFVLIHPPAHVNLGAEFFCADRRSRLLQQEFRLFSPQESTGVGAGQKLPTAQQWHPCCANCRRYSSMDVCHDRRLHKCM